MLYGCTAVMASITAGRSPTRLASLTGMATKAELQAQLDALKADNERLAAAALVTITARVPADLRADAKRVAARNGDTLQGAVSAGLRWYIDTYGQGD